VAKIPLTWAGGEERFNFLRLLATMFYPKSEAERGELYAVFVHDWLKTDQSNGVLWETGEREALERQTLYALPTVLFANSTERDSLTRFGHGLIAGMVLAEVLRLAQCAPEHASLSKAKLLAQSGLFRRDKELRNSGDRRRNIIPSSDESISNAWSEFRSVSHFYAALVEQRRLEAGRTMLERIDRSEHKIPREELFGFIALANCFCKLGEAHRSPRAVDSTLKTSENWAASVPTEISLPVVSLKFPRLDHVEEDLLIKYRSDIK
jgi:hypothetical protein